MNNIKGFVFYVDILGFTALTQDKIQLTEDDFNIWQVSKHFQTSGNQEFAANILIIFREILTNCQNKYPKVNFTQLSDCAFVWSENMKDVILSCHTIMSYYHVILSCGIVYRMEFYVGVELPMEILLRTITTI